MECLLVLFSYHHKNTEKIANVLAEVLDAEIRSPGQIRPDELHDYDLVGFGSGIYGAEHHESLLQLADRLPIINNGEAFLFSTCGIPAMGLTDEVMMKNHAPLRERLKSKGYTIVDEFSCVGLNTNSFLGLFGGINKGRPDTGDLKRAEEFARNLKHDLPGEGKSKPEENP